MEGTGMIYINREGKGEGRLMRKVTQVAVVGVLATIMLLIISVTVFFIDQNNQIAETIQSGVGPIETGCAFSTVEEETCREMIASR